MSLFCPFAICYSERMCFGVSLLRVEGFICCGVLNFNSLEALLTAALLETDCFISVLS